MRLAPIILTALITVAPLACSDRVALQDRADSLRARWLAGMWDASFALDVSLAQRDFPTPPVRGRIALLPNRWLDGSYPGIDALSDYGTYDVDFTSFGIEPRARGETPTVVAGWTGRDSVQFVLTSGVPSLSIVLRGRVVGDSITGRWTYTVARASGGGGQFVLVRAAPLGARAAAQP